MTSLYPAGATLLPLAYALAIGLLIGLERGWVSRTVRAGTRVAGVRTHGLLGLAGGIAGLLPMAAAVTILLIAGLIILAGYVRQSRDGEALSATGAVVGLIVLALGMAATLGHEVEALAVAAATMALLTMRGTLHGLLRGLTDVEMRAAARFAIMVLVLLPVLPDRAMGPYDFFNPHQLMLVVVLVTGLSFASYLLSRRLGAGRGDLLVAGLGALVSSTAVTAALARRLASLGQPSGSLDAGIALASAISVARVIILIGLLAPRALLPVGISLGPAVIMLLVATWWARRGASDYSIPEVTLHNPLELRTAVSLAMLVAITSLASRWALATFGDIGAGGVLAIIGLADVDAAVLSFAALPEKAISPTMAGLVLALPVTLNMLLKTILTLTLAGRGAGMRAAAPLAAASALLLASAGLSLIVS
ncbi:MAG: MgtC/SapB family protein [Pseudomonadota bacterium]